MRQQSFLLPTDGQQPKPRHTRTLTTTTDNPDNPDISHNVTAGRPLHPRPDIRRF
jgi:hypothetical protein